MSNYYLCTTMYVTEPTKQGMWAQTMTPHISSLFSILDQYVVTRIKLPIKCLIRAVHFMAMHSLS